MAGNVIGDKEMQVINVLTRTLVNDSDNRSQDDINALARSWFCVVAELPPIEHYEAITAAFMKIIEQRSIIFENEEFILLKEKCDKRFEKYSDELKDSLVKYYLSSMFAE